MDWNAVTLVVFDVDGTLYNQRRLRLKMARELLLHALRTRSWRIPRVLAHYRQLREQLAGDEVRDFEPLLLAKTASRCGLPSATVAALAAEWLEQRPLPHMPACRYDGLPELFQRLRARGKCIAILSDYAAQSKLCALGLAADIIVCAGDSGILKPHPGAGRRRARRHRDDRRPPGSRWRRRPPQRRPCADQVRPALAGLANLCHLS